MLCDKLSAIWVARDCFLGLTFACFIADWDKCRRGKAKIPPFTGWQLIPDSPLRTSRVIRALLLIVLLIDSTSFKKKAVSKKENDQLHFYWDKTIASHHILEWRAHTKAGWVVEGQPWYPERSVHSAIHTQSWRRICRCTEPPTGQCSPTPNSLHAGHTWAHERFGKISDYFFLSYN